MYLIGSNPQVTMDGVKVLTEAASDGAASASQVPSQPQQKTREAKCNKTADDVVKSNNKTSDSNGLRNETSSAAHDCAAEELASALEVKVNLENEHLVNGLTNGINQGEKKVNCKCATSDAKLHSEISSPCECAGSALVHNGAPSNNSQGSSDSGQKGSNTSDQNLKDDIVYVSYESELQMPDIMRIMNKDLSEPYSIYTYRYFIYNWPKLCFLAMIGSECVGAIVCKLDLNLKSAKRGYIAMLAVDSNHRNKGIGSNLVLKAIGAMVALNADEVVLESEITNSPALRLYENLGFVRDKRLFRYYLNGVDAFRLKLWLK
ncbi:N-alpha-acetyltransferase 30 [Frankliniella fusca]|uniref:N-terminal methionine N(alpha)-acetyltransferase NatC n=1 Tax=Frankliniella fusca TaxID=407009 RepID=A0AAE1H0W2_9NEOP|nr:N-alpha-acetyltransferase 30 [Frankliniella fusca]